MQNIINIVIVVACFAVAHLGAESLPIDPPPPIKEKNTGFSGRIEKESYQEVNKKYRNCTEKHKDKVKCENDRMEPSDKFIFEYKR